MKPMKLKDLDLTLSISNSVVRNVTMKAYSNLLKDLTVIDTATDLSASIIITYTDGLNFFLNLQAGHDLVYVRCCGLTLTRTYAIT